ncbi:MAG: MFS transporter [Dehalococcoidia bacterium]
MVAGQQAAPAGRLPRLSTLEAFRSAPFRYLWVNTFTFFMVMGIQRFAFVWLVLDLTSGPKAAGIVTFALGIPVLFVALPAGVLSDRVNRRTLLMASQGVATTVVLATAALIWADMMTVPLAVMMALLAGSATAMTQPVRTAIVPTLVERDRLMNAIVLTTLGMNVSMIIGPAIGGASIRLWGLAGSFAVQGAILALGWLMLVPLRVPKLTRATGSAKPMQDLREGLRFVVGERRIFLLIVLLVVSGMLMMGPSSALIPQIAKEELGKDALAASLLFAFVGVGMMATSLLLASLTEMPNKGGWFVVSLVLGGTVFAGIGLSPVYALTAVLMVIWGMGGGFFMNLNQTLIQGNTPHELMGRVMSIHTLGFMGLTPMGALLAGGMASVVGAPEWVAISGLTLTLVSAFILVTQPELRRME